MEKKILIISISAAVLLVAASFSSAIGAGAVQSSEKIRSPLFAIRTQRSIDNSNPHDVQTSYLGKGMTTTLFLHPKPSLGMAIDRTVNLLSQNPGFFQRFVRTISAHPRVIALLQEHGVSMTQFQIQLNRMKTDPSLFIDEIQRAELKLPVNQLHDPVPLGLNTSNPLGCVITAIALLPVVLVVALIVVVFTLRILQCLKLDEVMQQIFDQILQELYPSGYHL